ncbi:stage 0 sporulation protein J [Brachyspira pilosicoli B2904]|uniref:Stage 0 sporulation protein J n=1 Tax=Brachyspira pilosicoli B2904 TaxID=1133568 RepID=J9TVN7_BRAPL|nr:hypothetical protein [Brachyspira pilosicoli]AFR70532.1 stage 0 sporulation protein J [Brachyspira pilosicoli B2904]
MRKNSKRKKEIVKDNNDTQDKNIKKENKKDPNIKKLENDLEKIFSTKVNVIDKEGKEGKIIIEYYSADDLSRIMDILDNIHNINTNSIKHTIEY